MGLDHTHPQSFLLLLALIIGAAKTGGWLSIRLGQPGVLGEILAGVLLGPSLLNLLQLPPFRQAELGGIVGHLASLGVIFLMFIAGLETNLAKMRKVGRVAVLAGSGGVFIPLFLGMASALSFGYPLAQAAFVGIVLTATSVSITVQTLIELGRLDSKEGTTLLAAAVIDDVIAIIVFSVLVAASGAEPGRLSGVVLLIVRIALYLTLAIVGGTWAMARLLPAAGRLPVSEGLLALATVALLLLAWASEAIGQMASITGAYIAGVLVARTGFREEVEHRLRAFTYAILVPVFFISIGLQTNARALHVADVPFALLIILAAVLGKVVGCGGGALAGGFKVPEALRVGVGMVSRGEVGLILAALGSRTGLLTDRGFAVMVIMVLASTVITPVALKLTFPQPHPPLTEAEAVAKIMGEKEN